jgi:hypothetical protein
MNPVAIQYIWQTILESERSDEQFMDAVARGAARPIGCGGS